MRIGVHSKTRQTVQVKMTGIETCIRCMEEGHMTDRHRRGQWVTIKM